MKKVQKLRDYVGNPNKVCHFDSDIQRCEMHAVKLRSGHKILIGKSEENRQFVGCKAYIRN
jgi:hypothetical protein